MQGLFEVLAPASGDMAEDVSGAWDDASGQLQDAAKIRASGFVDLLKHCSRHHYPYVMLNDEPFTDEFKSLGWYLGNTDRATAGRDRLVEQNVIYGGSVSYRNMCRFNSGFFFKHPLMLKTVTSHDNGNTYNLCHFWSNFEIADMNFWRSKAYQDFFEYLDSKGGFYYERWGDAPVHSIAAGLFASKDQLQFFEEIGYEHNPYTHCPLDPKMWERGKCGCNPAGSFDYDGMPDEDYKAEKEAFVSGMTGSTVLHVNLISCVALASITLYSTVQTRLYGTKPVPFLPAFVLLGMPLLLSMTLFAEPQTAGPMMLSGALLAIAGAVGVCVPRKGALLPAANANVREGDKKDARTPPETGSGTQNITPLPALSTYRAHMMLMTVLGILAVDFTVFPRALAKCEEYGVSLMDLGVGSFVFSGGVVSAIPLLKNRHYLHAPMLGKFVSVLWKSAPIVMLGLVRVLLVKGTEYPEHETEYGTHWNFFLTLAVLPVLQVLLHPLILRVPVALLGVGVGLLQQLALSRLGLKEWVNFAPRVDLISANKEGLASLAGYLSIYLLGLATGTTILPPTPKFFSRLLKQRVTPADLAAPRQNDKTVVELASHTISWWTCLGLSRLVGMDQGVSRQTANFPYVLWIAAFNTSFILAYLVLDMAFYPAPPIRKPRASSVAPAAGYFDEPKPGFVSSPAQAPPLLEALNKNGLPVFLLANVGTGLVNLSMKTMYAGTVVSMTVLTVYALVVCGAAWAMRKRKLW
ncbi:GPI-anchored wall transfer protein [Mycena kentingensis (nom. inval.)]|nr:GPI-anchored wall transfer protein [Mycena kentingensis (nom. inval.)]